MKLGGWQGVSLIDYPENVCSVIFTQGCNFRCPYCHNPELVDPKRFHRCLPQQDILSHLQKRKGKVDAVTITGGEPTVQPDLAEYAQQIRAIPCLVKLDTNGSHPEVLEELLRNSLVDFVAMDVKAPLNKYAEITKSSIDTNKIKESIRIIKDSGVAHEFRTTVVKSLLKQSDLEKVALLIEGADAYVLQKFVPSKVLNQDFLKETSYSEEEFEALRGKINGLVKSVSIR